MAMMPDPTDGDNRRELYERCRSGVPCDEYTAAMQSAARLRQLGNEERARARIFDARWHRFMSLHPELGEADA